MKALIAASGEFQVVASLPRRCQMCARKLSITGASRCSRPSCEGGLPSRSLARQTTTGKRARKSRKCARCNPVRLACIRAETQLSGKQSVSCVLPFDQCLGCSGDVSHQLWGRLQIPVGVDDICVPHVRCERDEMAADLLTPRGALL
jgi:hypothetical protein